MLVGDPAQHTGGDAAGGLATAVAGRLRSTASGLADAYVAELRDHQVRCGSVDDPDSERCLEEEVGTSLGALARWLTDADAELDAGELRFYEHQAADAARQLVPLGALLEPVRLGGRLLWRWISEVCRELSPDPVAAAPLLERLRDFEDRVQHVLTEHYVRTRFHADADERHLRREIVEALITGRSIGAQMSTELAAGFGLDPHGECLVIVGVLETQDGETTAARLGETVEMFSHPSIGHPQLIAERGEEVVTIVPARQGIDDVVAEATEVVERLRRIHDLRLLVGISTPGSLSRVPDRYLEARTALRFATANETRVAAMQDVRLFDYLTSRLDPTARRIMAPEYVTLLHEDERLGNNLSETLVALADADLNVARAAKRLHLHPNTVHYRLRRIEELTGRNPRMFHELVDLLVALRCRS